MVELVDAPDIFGHTVFCDDIRFEVSGKLIFIGVYQGAMFINTNFPVTIPRLCFAISIQQKTELASSTIKLMVFVPGDTDDSPSIEAEVGETSEGALQKLAASNSQHLAESERTWLSLRSNLMFDSFTIQQEGVIKVRAEINGKRHRLGTLRVMRAPATPNKV